MRKRNINYVIRKNRYYEFKSLEEFIEQRENNKKFPKVCNDITCPFHPIDSNLLKKQFERKNMFKNITLYRSPDSKNNDKYTCKVDQLIYICTRIRIKFRYKFFFKLTLLPGEQYSHFDSGVLTNLPKGWFVLFIRTCIMKP